jgi:hypothetical protein
VINGAANEILAMEERKVREEWFDEECKQITKEQKKIKQNDGEMYKIDSRRV